MKFTSLWIAVAILTTGIRLHAQSTTSGAAPAALTPAIPYESFPTLSASSMLQPQYLQGDHFKVRDAAPTYAGSNSYTIDSDYGVFTADGNQMLMRRISEINGIAVPLNVAKDLVKNPVTTISSVPRGIWGFLNQAGQAAKETVEGRRRGAEEGGAVENLSGFPKTKRDLAIKLGVDPYSSNEAFQKELNKVAMPAFLGKFTVNLGMATVSGGAGAALSGLNWTNTLNDAMRDKSPAALRLMNLGLLMNGMGVAREDADAFLNKTAISPTTQTLIVAALAQLGNIPGQAQFIRQAADSQDEHDALSFLSSVQIMVKLNATAPVARILQLSGLTVCQTNDGTVVVPIQWDYAVWTPLTDRFIATLKSTNFATPATGYSIFLTGLISPATAQALAMRGVNVVPKALPGPLQ